MAATNSSSNGHVRYTVRSSDVLADMKINVCKEGSDTVVWYKERFLADDEIIEHLVENATSTVHWTIHRPNRGWYIRIRSPTFPPGVFISLTVLPSSSPYHSESALTLACRTACLPPLSPSLSLSPTPLASASSSRRSIDSDSTLTEGQQKDTAAVHSYPPTPPGSTVSPRLQAVCSAEVEAKLHQLSEASSSSSSQASLSKPGANPNNMLSPTAARLRPSSQLITSAQITHFLLTPHQHQTQQQQQPITAPRSLFSRIAEVLKSRAPARSSFSFNMCAIPPPHRHSPHSPSTPNSGSHLSPSSPSPSSPNSPGMHAPIPHPYPLLTFSDTTPVWTVGSTSGLLEVDEVGIRALGVDMSFYVAAALTYLEFLEEREGYLAAAAD